MRYKIYYKIIFFIYLLSCSLIIQAQDINIETKINGIITEGNLLLKDNDVCSVSLTNISHKYFNLSLDIYNCKWIFHMITHDGKKWSKIIHESTFETEIKITPDLFDNKEIDTEFRTTMDSVTKKSYQEGYIECLLKNCKTGEIKSFKKTFRTDLLPMIPQLKLTILEIDSSPEYPTYYHIRCEINTSNFEMGVLSVADDPSLPPVMVAYFDSLTPMPHSVKTGGEKNGHVQCEVYNKYGFINSKTYYLEPLITSIINPNIHNEQILITENKCFISGQENMKNIIITDTNGVVFYSVKNIKNTTISLNQGIYLLKIIRNNNQTIIHKILIK